MGRREVKIMDTVDKIDRIITDEEQQKKNFYEWCSMYDDTKHIKEG